MVLRPAHPGDLDALVRLHMDVFEGHRAVRLGAAYVRAGHAWFLAQPDAINRVAVQQGRLVGFVEGAPAGYAMRMGRAIRAVAMKALLRRPWLVLDATFRYALRQRLRGLTKRPPPSPHDDLPCPGKVFSLVSIGVAREAQGHGLAGRLLEDFEQATQQAGFTCLKLSVYRTNTRAARAYQKAGWQQRDVADPHGDYYWKQIQPDTVS